VSTINEVPEDWRAQITVDVPTAGIIAGGMSRASSYRAAARGELPTIPLGRRKLVPVAKLRRLLGELPESEASSPS